MDTEPVRVRAGSSDRLLQAALASTAERVVVAVSHPLLVPLSGEGVVDLLSSYGDASGSQRLEMLKATYELEAKQRQGRGSHLTESLTTADAAENGTGRRCIGTRPNRSVA